MESLVTFVQNEFVPKKEFPSFQAGDTITVYYEIREGEKSTQFFKGVVIQIKGTGATEIYHSQDVWNCWRRAHLSNESSGYPKN